MHSIEVSQLLTGQKYPRRIPLLGVSTEFKPKKPRNRRFEQAAFPRDFSVGFSQWLELDGQMLANTSSILKLLQSGFGSRKSRRRTWTPNQCLQNRNLGDTGYNKFEICEAPIPDIPLDLFSCQNVHYKAFHCKHELDTWNQQTTAIGTITEVACKKLLWISSQNWKRDVWNFDTKMIL